MSMPAVQFPKGISYEDFLATVDEGTHAEWVDGEVVPVTPPTKQHIRITSFLHAVLKGWAVRKKAGAVMHAPFQMKLASSGRIPDVAFLSREHEHRWVGLYIDGPADLVIEVVSPSTAAVDRGAKLREYEEGGVPEYWIVDPLREQVEVYVLGADGRYERVSLGTPPRIVSRVLPGLWLDPAWLWMDDPEKDIWEVYADWGLV